MASISKDVADVDINKPGFFHLCYNLDKNEQVNAPNIIFTSLVPVFI